MEENEVKPPLGGKGMGASKDGGVEESSVSCRQVHWHHNSFISHLLFTFSTPSLCDQSNQNVATVTEDMPPLGVKGVGASKDGGVEESYVSADKYTPSYLYHHSSLIYVFNPFSL